MPILWLQTGSEQSNNELRGLTTQFMVCMYHSSLGLSYLEFSSAELSVLSNDNLMYVLLILRVTRILPSDQ